MSNSISGSYYCNKCKIRHRRDSKIGKKHFKFRKGKKPSFKKVKIKKENKKYKINHKKGKIPIGRRNAEIRYYKRKKKLFPYIIYRDKGGIHKIPAWEKRDVSFDIKYKQALGKKTSGLMARRLPRHVKNALSKLVNPNQEYDVQLDFELYRNIPERLNIKAGMKRSVIAETDLELGAHTHPESRKGKYSLNIYPSGADFGVTKIDKPQLLVSRDGNGRTRYCLIRTSKQENDYLKTKRMIDEIIDEISKKSGYYFTSSRKRKKYFENAFKKAVNKIGFDFKFIDPSRKPIIMRMDSQPERRIILKRKERIERFVIRALENINVTYLFEKKQGETRVIVTYLKKSRKEIENDLKIIEKHNIIELIKTREKNGMIERIYKIP